MGIEQTIADARELCYRVASAELAGSPLWIVSQTQLPPLLGAIPLRSGFAPPFLAMHLHHILPDWDGGRGPVTVLASLNIEHNFPQRTYNKMLGTSLHEMAHCLKRPSLF